MRGYLPLIQKDSITHMHGLEVYGKEGVPFEQDLSLENSADSYLFFFKFFKWFEISNHFEFTSVSHVNMLIVYTKLV